MHETDRNWIMALDPTADIAPQERGRLRALRAHAGPEDVALIDRLLSPTAQAEDDAFARGVARAGRLRSDDIRSYPAPTSIRI